MKVKLGQIVNSVDAFNKIGQQPMKASVSYEVSKNIKNLSDELAIYEQSRSDLIRKYGEENKEDGSFAIKPDSKELPRFQKELGDLLNLEVDLNGFKHIKLSNLSECELTPHEMASLEYAIKE